MDQAEKASKRSKANSTSNNVIRRALKQTYCITWHWRGQHGKIRRGSNQECVLSLNANNQRNWRKEQIINAETATVEELDEIISTYEGSASNEEMYSKTTVIEIGENQDSDSSLNDLEYEAFEKIMDKKMEDYNEKRFIDDNEENVCCMREGLLLLSPESNTSRKDMCPNEILNVDVKSLDAE